MSFAPNVIPFPRSEPFDCSDRIGPLFEREAPPAWPMYSFDRPAFIVWNAIGGVLKARGWGDQAIAEWLQSREPRWALDGSLGDELADMAARWAAKNV